VTKASVPGSNCHPEADKVIERSAVRTVPKGTPNPHAYATQRFRAGLELYGHFEAEVHSAPATATSTTSIAGFCEGTPSRNIRQSAKALSVASLAVALFLLSACGHKNTAAHIPPPPTVTSNPPVSTEATTKPAPPPSEKTGKHHKPVYVETGMASWYGPPYHHRRGANGEIYDQNALTAAHRTLPMNSVVRVTNESTQHSVVVRITDRGPFVEDRVIDLSLAAAKAVDVWRPGTAMVKIEVLSAPAPIFDGGRWCVQIGAFQSQREARKLKEKLQDHYQNAQVIEFTGPTGEWVRIRPEGDDKRKAQEVASKTHVKEGGVFLVRLD
jgi:peptidoglycan lytic transglycosylase